MFDFAQLRCLFLAATSSSELFDQHRQPCGLSFRGSPPPPHRRLPKCFIPPERFFIKDLYQKTASVRNCNQPLFQVAVANGETIQPACDS